MRPEPTVIAYFKGVRPGSQFGHGFYKPGMKSVGVEAAVTPWFDPRYRVGTGVQSLDPMRACWDEEREWGDPEGQARFAREDGWTLITLWDRSGDPRRTCSSVFAIQADLADEEALALARMLFPTVFARIEHKVGHEVRLGAATCPLCRQSLEPEVDGDAP